MKYEYSFKHFLKKYPRYKKRFGEKNSVKELYDFLKKPVSIEKMITANNFDLPALSGVVNDIESKFNNRTDLDLKKDIVRQMVGCMIQEILNFYGYKSKIQRVVRNAKYFKSATHYEFETKLQKYKIVKKPVVKEI